MCNGSQQQRVLESVIADKVCTKMESSVNRFLGSSRFVKSSACKNLPQFDRNEVVLGKLLGSGGFSQAFEVKGFCPSEDVTGERSTDQEDARAKLLEKSRRKVKGTGQFVVKHIQSKFLDNPSRFKDAGVDIIIEAHFLASIKHPNILGIEGLARGGVSAYSGGSHEAFFIIMERLHETLDQRIKRWDAQLKRYRQPGLEKIAREGEMQQLLFTGRLKVARDVANAMAYLHSKGIIYRDTKPSNIGFDMEGNVKIFDFGLSRELPEENPEMGDVFKMSGKVGTVRYMSNECCKGEPYNQKSDVYSLSMVLWEMLALEKPFKTYTKSMHRELVVEEAERPQLDPSWPYGIQALLHCGWSPHISVRPSMKDFHKVLVQEIMELQHTADGRRVTTSRALRRNVKSFALSVINKMDSQRSLNTAETLVGLSGSLS